MAWLWNPPKWGPSTMSVAPTWQMCLWWSTGPSTLGLPSWCILSGDFTVDLGQAHACYPEWRNKNLYLISRTFICGLQIEFEIFFFSSLLSIWDWVLWIENETLLSNPLLRIGGGGGGEHPGPLVGTGGSGHRGNYVLFLLHSQSQGGGRNGWV